jgi:hypothetical protein
MMCEALPCMHLVGKRCFLLVICMCFRWSASVNVVWLSLFLPAMLAQSKSHGNLRKNHWQ